ncbi:phosphopantetheine adenylyltransferase [Halanaerobium saccharolyticum]|uniref:Phosphopantetheine adenylyltransferase n=1 Tax=Halanaerobium saccharolyticum TaxID=43595 RepID=A0A4R7YS40_9FIRM|nr:pantetheine-phosphate adenylyltransferase [Halanaerobium saccharolyticum]RAK04083.1 phosphopantetheine adenylyltransferase [Halanaerobium saccharolyticum]TDV97653.1 phosphopantetheine adenylyltransferase [Halanaerobium saccharolyticum]TDX50922.1 phosphopantetheine adenylyltransferase [Halanaerobium saccharolyticum]
MSKKIVYPGSFDPVTNGHLDIVERAANIFDEVIVSVFCNPNKEPVFTMEERVKMLKKATNKYENVKVDSFSGLTTKYVNSVGGEAILRGLRAVSDFEGEFQMASMNKHLDDEIETIFLMTDTKYAFLSSSVIKEAAYFDGNIKELVPDFVYQMLRNKFVENNKG